MAWSSIATERSMRSDHRCMATNVRWNRALPSHDHRRRRVTAARHPRPNPSRIRDWRDRPIARSMHAPLHGNWTREVCRTTTSVMVQCSPISRRICRSGRWTCGSFRIRTYWSCSPPAWCATTRPERSWWISMLRRAGAHFCRARPRPAVHLARGTARAVARRARHRQGRGTPSGVRFCHSHLRDRRAARGTPAGTASRIAVVTDLA